MKRLIVLQILFLWVTALMAQYPRHGGKSSMYASMMSQLEPGKGVVMGLVIDQQQKPVSYSTVTLRRMSDSSIVAGQLTDTSGRFVLMNIPYGKYMLIVKFVGFKKKIITGIAVSPKKRFVRVGKIELSQQMHQIDQVVVTASARDVEYRVDKKVIHVSQDLANSSGNAVDVLQNIPSVQVDIQGNVTLRGSSNFTVFINGKPSVLDGNEALQQIPASEIDRIEIITNPSAKYDPDGVAGIINIITKQQRKKGYNGLLSLSYDNYDALGVNALLNLRKNKFNFFVSFDYHQRKRPADLKSLREITTDTTLYRYNTDGYMEFGFGGWKAKTGFNYYINDKNTLTVYGVLGNRSFGMHSGTQISEMFYRNDALVFANYYQQFGYSSADGLLYQGNIDFEHKFNDKGHKLRAYIDVSNWMPQRINGTLVDTTDAHWNVLSDASYGQESREMRSGLKGRLQVDYELPLQQGRKLEAGYVGRYLKMESDYKLFDRYGDADWTELTDFSNDLVMIRDIQAIYFTYTGKLAKLFDYQLGLRTEYTYRLVSQKATAQDFTINRFDFFPTAHISRRFGDNFQLQLGYSRRVRRPRGWFLNPFPTYIDQYTVQQGNPELLPAFSDSYELSLVKYFKKSFLSVDAFWRQTKNDFQRIQTVGDNNTIINTWINAGKNMSGGAEISANLSLMRFIMLNASSSVYYYRIIGTVDNQSVDNSTVTWNSRLMTMVMLPTGTRLQLTGFYRAPTVTLQGRSEAFIMTSVALRQDFFKRKVSLTLSVRDPFKWMRFASVVETPDLYSENVYIMRSPNISATLQIRLNDYKPQRNRRSNGDDVSEFEGEGLY